MFAGSVTVIGSEEYKRIVLPTSLGDKVKFAVFVKTTPVFAILGSTSNLSSTEFHSRAFPARSEYAPVAVLIAFAIAVFLFTISAASASARFCRCLAIEGVTRFALLVLEPS